MKIETERLVLRDWREGDAEPFERHTNTPAVMQWLGGVKPPEIIREVVTDRLMRWQEELGFTFWLVERKEDCELLGFCGIKMADDPASPVEGEYEIGWRLREDAWGQGYAKEAASASLDHLFNAVGAERVVALTVLGNEPSWGLMERLGMKRRPDLDYTGPAWAEGEVIVYTLERREWLARTS
ncbi:MAG TPA: GNAT family N-acetyltransferase [Allosphingosinicella sp.]|jgi:RimJ/RimL family protein N-acetyltransferase